MENSLNNVKPLIQGLESYCKQIDLDAKVEYNKTSALGFTINLKNKFSRNLVNSLVQNIINIKEESFDSILGTKENGMIKFSILAKKDEENKFLNNLLNFIKIIKLNNLFTTETNNLEQTVPIKIFQTLKIVDEDKLPGFTISYILSSCQIKIQENLFTLNDGIDMLNNLQNNQNYTTKFLNLGTNNTDLQNFKLSNIKNFCKTVPVGYSAISNVFSKIH